MRYFFAITVLFSLLFGALSGVQAKTEESIKTEDYKFYKKYGNDNKQWDEEVRAGFAAYEAQDCAATLQHLMEAVRRQTKDSLVYFKLAVCNEAMDSPYTALQYYELAQSGLQQLKGSHPYQREIFENQGRLLWKSKRYKEALPLLKQASIVGTPSFGLYYMLASIYAEQEQLSGALEYYQKALAQDTSQAEPGLVSQVYLEVAKAHYQNKDYKAALPLLDQAVRLNPQNQEAAQLKTQVATSLQQDSMVEMLEKIKQEQGLGTQE